MARTHSPGDDVRFFGGLAYAAPLGFRPLLLDLYRPAGPDPAPLVVFMHGGGWLRGDRSMVSPQFASWRPGPLARLAADGFAVASVDYRLSGEARFPAQLEDVSAAVDWLTGQAAEYGFDASRIVLWGESAGAHLAALLGLQSTGSRVRGVVDWYGPADLLALDEEVGAAGALTDDPLDSRQARLLGAPVAAQPAAAVHEHDQRRRIRSGGRQVQVEQQRAEPDRGGVDQAADEPHVVTGGGGVRHGRHSLVQ